MKAYYAPIWVGSSSGGSYSGSYGEDLSEQIEYITQKICKYAGEDEEKNNLGNGRNEETESNSDSSTDKKDGTSPPAKVSVSLSPEVKKGKIDAFRKHRKLSRSSRAAIDEAPKVVNVLEDESKYVLSKKTVQQNEQLQTEKERLQAQQKAGPISSSPHKRKRLPEHANQKQESELKSRKTAQTWTSKDELLLATHFLIDMKHGRIFPVSKGDDYWDDLLHRLQDKLERHCSKEQIYVKYRKMKSRHDVLRERLMLDSTKLPKYKGAEEEKLFKAFQQLWDKEGVELNQKSEKPPRKSATSCQEEEEGSSGKKAAGEEKEHSVEDEEQTSEEDKGLVAKHFALEPVGKTSKTSKANLHHESYQNGFLQNDSEVSDLKTVTEKVHGRRQISGSENFEEAVQAASLSIALEFQTKFLATFKEEQAKTYALIEKIFKEEQAKSVLVEEIVRGFRWFSQLWIMSLPAMLPRLLQGFTDCIESEVNESMPLLQQQWLQQQR